MVPELRQLRYFVAVAEELHFSRAAKRLNIAQPPLTQQIQLLERSLGVRLFARTTRRVELTPAGTAFLEGARRALAEAERAGDLARRAARGDLDTLRIGFTDAAMMSVLPDAIDRYRKEFPGVHLDLRDDGAAAQLDESLRHDLIDIGLMRGPLEATPLRVETIFEEPFCVALPESHVLARRSRIPIRLLRDLPFVLFPRRISPAYYDQLLGACQKAGFRPEIAYEAVKYSTVIGLIAAGCGVTLVPRSNANLTRTGVTYRPLTGLPATAAVVAAYRLDRMSPVLSGFLAATREAARVLARRSPVPLA
jgi:DNA-binding transcriptional LysR family regulator